MRAHRCGTRSWRPTRIRDISVPPTASDSSCPRVTTSSAMTRTTCFATIPETDSSGVPQLGPLANNGGPTRTHALTGLARSHRPRSDRGEAARARTNAGPPATSPCDTGAYELVECGSVSVTVVGTDGSDVIDGHRQGRWDPGPGRRRPGTGRGRQRSDLRWGWSRPALRRSGQRPPVRWFGQGSLLRRARPEHVSGLRAAGLRRNPVPLCTDLVRPFPAGWDRV